MQNPNVRCGTSADSIQQLDVKPFSAMKQTTFVDANALAAIVDAGEIPHNQFVVKRVGGVDMGIGTTQAGAA
jgi:hypothetical protein